LANRRIRQISAEQRAQLLDEIRNRIKTILDNVCILLDNNGDPQISAALYIHAVEEYGKYLLVQRSQNENGTYEINMNDFRDHKKKIDSARSKLPSDCIKLNNGVFNKKIFQPNVFQIQSVADWPTRLTIFNTDLDDNGTIKQIPHVDVNTLKTAVNSFRNALTHLERK
jgi:AbiV family abortive infection protein